MIVDGIIDFFRIHDITVSSASWYTGSLGLIEMILKKKCRKKVRLGGSRWGSFSKNLFRLNSTGSASRKFFSKESLASLDPISEVMF